VNQLIEAQRLVTLLNTLHVPDHDDELADDRAGSWVAGFLADAGEAAVGQDVGSCEDLRDLREGLRQLAVASGGAEPDAGVLKRARAVLRASPLVVELGHEAQPPRLVATGDPGPVGRAVTVVAAAYLSVRTGSDWARVKVCAAPDCRWAFLDTSRNGTRRWCDMSDCGNRAKNRTWRERRRTSAQSSPSS
jgi:predicted RNA-binding Zn ribbon-like protein